MQWQLKVSELHSVSHASNPIMLLYQFIFFFNYFMSHFFGRRELIFYDLKHHAKRGQGKDTHHHAFDARSDHKLIARLI